jgi:hypothetical protein
MPAAVSSPAVAAPVVAAPDLDKRTNVLYTAAIRYDPTTGRVTAELDDLSRILFQVRGDQAVYRFSFGKQHLDAVIGRAKVLEGQVVLTLPL